MMKCELMKALEGLDDDAQIFVRVRDDNFDDYTFYVADIEDKVTGNDIQNEITLVCE